MSTSLDQMQQRLAKNTSGDISPSQSSPVSKPVAAPGGGTSLEDMRKRLAPKAPTTVQTLGSGLADAARQSIVPYWSDYKKTAQAYADSLSEDMKSAKSSPDAISGFLGSLKALNDVLGAAQAPLESALRTGVLQPVQVGVAKLGQLVSDHLASPDVDPTPEQKRVATLTGVPVARQYSKGVDWKVHKQDVQSTIEGINTGLESLFGAGLMVAEGKLAAPAEEKAPLLGEQDKANIIRSQRRDAGQTPSEGKPHVTLAQAQSGIRQATQDLTEPTIDEERLKNLDLMADGGGAERKPVSNLQAAMTVRNAIDTAVLPIFAKHADVGKPTTGGEILDQLQTVVKQVKGSEAWQSVIEGLRKHVADVDVHLKWQLPDWAKGPNGDPVQGYYDREEHQVHVSVREASSPFHTTIHELEHAATARYVARNPTSPLVKRLGLVLQEARKRAVRMGEIETRGQGTDLRVKQNHYGLTNDREFLSELKSNPKFVDFLSRSEAHASPGWKGIKIFNHLADLFRKMLGIKDPQATPLLHESMFLGSEIAKKQAGGDHLTAVRRMTEDVWVDALDLMPRQIDAAEKKLAGWYTDVLKTINVEGLGPKAKAAGSIIAKAIADRVRSTTVFTRNSEPRKMWWEARLGTVDDFVSRYEKGDQFKDNPALARIADNYRQWNAMIFMQDLDHGILYDPVDNYISHIFEDPDGVRQWADQTYGTKWGDPSFTKDRTFSLYEEAIKHNFVPKFKNPEEIMLARQKASDIAVSKVQALEEMDKWGLAVKKPPGSKNFKTKFQSIARRSPNGDWYYVHQEAAQPLFNAFDSKSLWAADNLGGSVFRGGMAVKNTVVPLRLGFSLFHALHVAHIANADMVAMNFKGMLAGTVSPVKAGLEFAKAVPLLINSWKNAKIGANIVDVWLGKTPEHELNSADKQNLQFMSEGGFIPIMDHHWTVGAVTNFKKALAQARGGDGIQALKSVWHAPWALMEGLQAPLFQTWIPNLKAASYLKNVREAVQADPALLNNTLKRQQAFRRIAQSVDNRYGEMNYETLLWKKWAKDLAVLNTLSLGWQLGFLREYGGGAMDLGQFALRGDRMQSIKEGQIDRALFASTYTLTALGYGGLLTWAMTGEAPQSLTDYVLPKTGGTGQDGQPQRVNTMFYTREFQAIYKHVEAKGLMTGLGQLVESKASGVIGLFAELAKGVNSFGQQIRDPAGPEYQKIAQSLAYVMSDLEPIAFKSMEGDPGSVARSIMGFTPAPAYMTDSATVGRIKDSYERMVAPTEKPYDRMARSKAFTSIRKHYANGQPIGNELDQVSKEYSLSGREQRQLIKDLNHGGPPSAWMFQRLPWEEQKRLLDNMTPEERGGYLALSNKQHLRGRYASPGT